MTNEPTPSVHTIRALHRPTWLPISAADDVYISHNVFRHIPPLLRKDMLRYGSRSDFIGQYFGYASVLLAHRMGRCGKPSSEICRLTFDLSAAIVRIASQKKRNRRMLPPYTPPVIESEAEQMRLRDAVDELAKTLGATNATIPGVESSTSGPSVSPPKIKRIIKVKRSETNHAGRVARRSAQRD